MKSNGLIGGGGKARTETCVRTGWIQTDQHGTGLHETMPLILHDIMNSQHPLGRMCGDGGWEALQRLCCCEPLQTLTKPLVKSVVTAE